MTELDGRISALRNLLSAGAPAPSVETEDELDLFEGHEPAHAAPGPLTDKLRSPDTPAEHRPMHADAS